VKNFSLVEGAQIAHYRVDRRIGAGGMGEVFLASDTTLERSVALKILPPTLLGDTERVRRFVQEAKSASALNHPNIVTIYEIGQAFVISPEGEASAEKVHYMAMEFIEGQTLREMIYGTAPLKDILGVLAQAADGLGKAHGAGIVHRDLKPDNIMVTSDGYAKVVDFGLAKLTEKKQDQPGNEALTQSGMVMGTIGYMSPEQIEGGMLRPPSDIFAFGCILYEAAAKKRPFQAEMAIDTMHKIMFSEPMPLSAHAADLPAPLQAIVDRCLKKNADDRYSSMREVAAGLREIIGSGPSARPAVAQEPSFESPRQSDRQVRPVISVRAMDDHGDYAVQPRSGFARAVSASVKLLIAALAGILIYVGVTMPDVDALAEGKPASVQSSWSDYDEMAPSLRRAAVASLDPDFFERKGIGAKTAGAAAKSIASQDRRLYAPSPLTIQVARALYGGSGINPAKRIKNWAIAGMMHSKLSNQRILELYLNTASYGESVGAADAAKRYFNKGPRRLTEAEAALLAAAALTSGSNPADPSAELTAVKASILAGLGRDEKTSVSTKPDDTSKKSTSRSSSSKKKKAAPVPEASPDEVKETPAEEPAASPAEEPASDPVAAEAAPPSENTTTLQ
jgi:serine/threonine protein kinase